LWGLRPQPPGGQRINGRRQRGRSRSGCRGACLAGWGTGDRRARGSHSGGALSSRRRGGGYREGDVSSSREPSGAQTIPAEEVTTSRQRTLLMSPKCGHC
jgi:hypothetical protein